MVLNEIVGTAQARRLIWNHALSQPNRRIRLPL